jgi:hypothetical protein
MLRLSMVISLLLVLSDARAQLIPFAFLSKTATPSCGGTMVGGYCWYLGAASASCTTTCSSHGGYNDAGTRGYAGSDGTDAQCGAVASAVNGKTFYMSAPGTAPIGCCYASGVALRVTDPTTAAASISTYQRYCACNN